MWKSVTAMLLAVIGLSELACTTVTPRAVVDNGPSWDGGQRDSGFRGWYTNGQREIFAVISPNARARYNALIPKYGSRFPVPLTPDAGIQPFTNGTFLIDSEHDVKARDMIRWNKSTEPK